MNIRFQPLAWVVVAAAMLSAVSVFGQGGGGRDRRREGYDPAESLKRMDENKNGLIEPSEISGRSRSFVENAAQRAKLDITKPMSIDKLLPAMQAVSEEFRKQQEASRGPGGAPPSSPSPPTSSMRPPATSAPPASTSSGFGAPSSRAGIITSLDARFDPSVTEYVNDKLLKVQDKNGDGSIDKAEWTAAGTWSKSNPPENSDLNKDGKLSREELYIRKSKSENLPYKGETTSSSPGSPLSSYGPPGGAPPRGLGGGPPSGGPPGVGGSSPYGKKGKGDKTAATDKKSYRFLTPTERLPKGMPDWFIKNDADGDGQIMMAEYSTSWTDAEAAKFAKYDLDGDGIITPNECLAVEPKK